MLKLLLIELQQKAAALITLRGLLLNLLHLLGQLRVAILDQSLIEAHAFLQLGDGDILAADAGNGTIGFNDEPLQDGGGNQQNRECAYHGRANDDDAAGALLTLVARHAQTHHGTCGRLILRQVALGAFLRVWLSRLFFGLFGHVRWGVHKQILRRTAITQMSISTVMCAAKSGNSYALFLIG